ncbi:PhzF family phenazine biosynthesis protein [Paraburkholderia sp. BCC1886]|uniref:PhzF family phenazine biosynthesis protein n=1 Tax=Paraburkholderia sp. BCC1886 TaxID=2562670 RepID=UPI0011837D88|nr:PhzF family phenazine biosynthesis protein [Paraburkholderia sp. BCC1886]
MNIHRFLCFGRTDGSGNAAIVVEDSQVSEPERRKFARQQDANATVFVETDSACARLDYYYPHTRSPLCLHATLAASAVFFERYPERRQTQFVTSMHRQVLEVERSDHGIFIGVRAQPCPTLREAVTETARLLRVEPSALIGIPRFGSVGSTKLLVQMKGQSALDALNPDLKAIASWSREHGVAGVFAYCHHNDDIYAGRNFNHLEPHLEDAATGVAAGALASVLERNITLLQGDALGRPCLLLARHVDGTVQIGGRATRSAA